jgi:acyl carrier protein
LIRQNDVLLQDKNNDFTLKGQESIPGSKEEVLSRVVEIGRRFAKESVTSLDNDLHLRHAGVLDSLGMIHFILAIEDCFQIEFADSELDLTAMGTFRQVANVVWNKLKTAKSEIVNRT